MANFPYTMVVAMAKNRVIGSNNAMPWDLPQDLQRFKRITMGKVMIMGGTTFRSLPGVLPGRHHIVITSQPVKEHPMVQSVPTPEKADKLAQQITAGQQQQQIMVIGGGQIYAIWLPKTTTIELTEINTDFEGDTFFPELEENQWRKEIIQPWQQSCDSTKYRFVRLQRI